MCGIVGGVGAPVLECLDAMNHIQAHRGPDDGGHYIDHTHQVALAMRRLSILDISGGHQPMSNEDDSLRIVYNGEIYNAPGLRIQLEAHHQFKTQNSDTEALLHLYEEHHADMLTMLNGMFAFVMYDQARGVLFGARDPFGIKPLYYYKNGTTFAFASELTSLLLLPEISRNINEDSLSHYLSLRYVPGTNTIFEGVHRLAPAHYFMYDVASHEFKTQRYWELTFEPDPTPSLEDWQAQIRYELGQAVQRWSLSDVPLGCSLSGGLDSSAIVALLSQSGAQVKTYSLGFRDHDELDELHLARKTAQKWATQHHELCLEPDQLLDSLIDMVWHLGEPYGGGLPSWYIFQFMRESVTVGLTGSGGDELFGNYGKYALAELRGLKRSRGAYQLQRNRSSANYIDALKLAATVNSPAWQKHPLRLYQHQYYTDQEKADFVLQRPATSTIDFLIYTTEQPHLSARDQFLVTDLQTQLSEEFLFMTDRFSMAHSLEARVPFLDRDFVKLVSTIPSHLRTRPHDPKYLLRQAVTPLLPEGLSKTPKRGFILPLDEWLRGKLRGLIERLLSPDYLTQQGIFDPAFYHRLVAPHLSGKANYGERIWPVIMFQLWYIVFIEQASNTQPHFTWQDLV